MLQRTTGWLWSLRGRVVAGYVVLVAFALILSLLIARSALMSRLDRDVDARLAAEVEQLVNVIDQGDPATDGPFTDVESLFSTYLRSVLPADDDAFFTLIDGQPFEFSFDPPAELFDDPSLAVQWSDITASTFDTIETVSGSARVLAVPVLIDDARGTFVVVAFTDAEREELGDVLRILALVAGAALLATALVAWSVAGRVMRPIQTLTKVTETITENDLSGRLPSETRTTDVAKLTRAFNAMMTRLEDGFGSQRQFLDDVAHELRTPITIVQGHLDVLGDDPDEVADTVELLHDELDRMNRYVDDLLVLAQAEQPDFVRPQPVELAPFLGRLGAKLAPLADRRWVVDDVHDVTARFDPQRMTQALLNLAANAARHTEAGTEIVVSVHATETTIDFAVVDNGTGVDPAIVDEVFNRHVRSATSRSRGGVGLGLSIVDAIAVAHGGSARVESSPGAGATFTIAIPRHADPSEPTEREPHTELT